MEREFKGWSSGQVVNSHSCRPGTPYQGFRTCSEHCRIPLDVITASQYDMIVIAITLSRLFC